MTSLFDSSHRPALSMPARCQSSNAGRAGAATWHALPRVLGVALLCGAAGAGAQTNSWSVPLTGQATTSPAGTGVAVASLSCQPATVTVFPGCGGIGLCPGPGTGGVGMSQLLGTPSFTAGVTGSAVTTTALWGIRPVDFSYTVPDVRVFAPLGKSKQLQPVTTQTWIIKSNTVPGAQGSNFITRHFLGNVSASLTGKTDTTDSTSTDGNWLLVGYVEGQAVVNGRFENVNFGFSCTLPVQNLKRAGGIYQPPPTFRP